MEENHLPSNLSQGNMLVPWRVTFAEPPLHLCLQKAPKALVRRKFSILLASSLSSSRRVVVLGGKTWYHDLAVIIFFSSLLAQIVITTIFLQKPSPPPKKKKETNSFPPIKLKEHLACTLYEGLVGRFIFCLIPGGRRCANPRSVSWKLPKVCHVRHKHQLDKPCDEWRLGQNPSPPSFPETNKPKFTQAKRMDFWDCDDLMGRVMIL